MKKLITAVLILSLLLPAAALAADPIVGCWYMCVNVKEHPEMRATYGDCDLIVDVYVFNNLNTISLIESVVKDNQSTPTYNGAGLWQKNGDEYSVTLVGLGETTMTVNGNEAYLKIPNMTLSISMILRRMVEFDMYKDYKY